MITKTTVIVICLLFLRAGNAQAQQNSVDSSGYLKSSGFINLDSVSNVIDSLSSILLIQNMVNQYDRSTFIKKTRDHFDDTIILSRMISKDIIKSMYKNEESKKKWEEELRKSKLLFYGENNVTRIPSFSSPGVPAEVSASGKCVCAIIHKKYLIKSANGYILNATRLGDNTVAVKSSMLKLCPSEKFLDEVIASTGTGWAYKRNLIVTANHCFDKIDSNDYKNYYFVFDFLETSSGVEISEERVFKPVGRVNIQPQDRMFDFTIIKVDRLIPPFRYAQLDTLSSSPIDMKTTRLYMLGHPLGLPLKYTPKGQICYYKDNFFITNLDAYAGNSGSPVFHSETKKVVGILVSGNSDFEQAPSGCAVSVHFPVNYPENHCGEKVERIINALKKY